VSDVESSDVAPAERWFASKGWVPLEFQRELPLRGVQGMRSLSLALQFSADVTEFQCELPLRGVQDIRSLGLALQCSADAPEFQREFLLRGVQGFRSLGLALQFSADASKFGLDRAPRRLGLFCQHFGMGELHLQVRKPLGLVCRFALKIGQPGPTCRELLEMHLELGLGGLGRR